MTGYQVATLPCAGLVGLRVGPIYTVMHAQEARRMDLELWHASNDVLGTTTVPHGGRLLENQALTLETLDERTR